MKSQQEEKKELICWFKFQKENENWYFCGINLHVPLDPEALILW